MTGLSQGLINYFINTPSIHGCHASAFMSHELMVPFLIIKPAEIIIEQCISETAGINFLKMISKMQ